ncbi:MAG TPA: hypothetical protein VII08_06000 [Myxococcales bacterium]
MFGRGVRAVPSAQLPRCLIPPAGICVLPVPAIAMQGQYLAFIYAYSKRIADMAMLKCEIALWTRLRNASGARVRWLFDVQRARNKLGHAYPRPAGLDLKSAF